MTQETPMQKAKEIVVQRYAQEFRGMTSMGERLIRSLVELDLEGRTGEFERLVLGGAEDEELVAFAERMMGSRREN